MRFVARFRSACRALFRSRQVNRELDDELRFALEELTERHRARGLSVDAARRTARLELGGIEQIKEEVRGRGVSQTIETTLRDIRYGWRTVSKAPLFSTMVAGVLAAGIGAATAVFSLVNALLLSPLPYRDADRLMFVWQDLTRAGYPRAPLAGPELQDLRDRSQLFSGFGGIWANTVALTDENEPEQLRVGLVTPDFFDVLGAEALLGRTFRPGDEADGAPTSILLSAALWKRRYGGDADLVGQQIQVNGRPANVLGVMPDSFRLLLPVDSAIPDDQQAWLLLGRNAVRGPRQQQFVRVVGRLEPGVDLEDGKREIAAIGQQVGREFVEYGRDGATFYGVGLQADATREARPALLALLGAVCLLLTIACVNVAGLLMTRAAARHHETAIRLAIGAGRLRVLRQYVIEGLLLSCLGGAGGVLIAEGLLAALVTLRPASLSRLDATPLDVRVLAFTATVSIVWGVLFSLAPFAQMLRTNVSAALQGSGRSSMGVGHHRLRAGLLMTQVAITCVLVVTAGLLARGFYELHRVDAGFRDEGILTFKVSLAGTRHRGPERVNTFSRQLRDRLRALPDVHAAGAISHLPYDTVPNWGSPYLPELVDDVTQAGVADSRAVLPGYFEAVGAELVEGRWFNDGDGISTMPVTIVDTRLAARLWPGQSAIGRRIKADPGTTGEPRVTLTVVGVVRHMRHRELTKDLREQVYFPAQQSLRNPMAHVIHASGDPERLVPAVRHVMAAIDPTVPIYDVRTLSSYTRDAQAVRKFTFVLALAFACSALLLASIGVYGVTAYLVVLRRREFGLRFALGARASQVLGMVMRDGARLVLRGSALGAVGAVASARLIETQLYGVTPRDPLTYVAGIALVIASAAAACWIPARRAARSSPMESLRLEGR